MAQIDGGHDVSQIPANTGFSPLPEDWYKMIIEESPIKNSSNGHRMYAMKLKVIDGPYTNRVVFWNLNYYHPDEQTRNIARGNMSSIIKACGLARIADTTELHNIPIYVKLRVKGEFNEFKDVKSQDEFSKTTKPTATATTNGGGAMDWMKKKN